MHLIERGVKVNSLPGGSVQLLGKYGSILLTHDITALSPEQLEQLCGDFTPRAGAGGTAVHTVQGTPQGIDALSNAPTTLQAPWYEP